MTVSIPVNMCTVRNNEPNVNFELIDECDEVRFHLTNRSNVHISGYYLFAFRPGNFNNLQFAESKSNLIFLRLFPFIDDDGIKLIEFDKESQLKITGVDEI